MTGLPPGFRLTPDADLRQSDDGTVLTGGTPWRLLRLTAAGAGRARRLLAGETVADAADAVLARRLVRGGLAHPIPPDHGGVADIDVVVPAHDRLDALDRCLSSLGTSMPVCVVDDASADGVAVARAAARHGARVVRHDANRGPAAARNTGLAATTAPFVAFVDSDCRAHPDDLVALAAHLADPEVGATAARVRSACRPASSALDRFAASRSPLDLGERSAEVRPNARVSYVPATVLLVRRDAIDAVGGFDEDLRYGEDVDLVWRLADAGWSVRYDAAVHVLHDEPATWRALLARRHRYGTGAGSLAQRHGDRLAGPAVAGLIAPAFVMRGAAPEAVPPEVRRAAARVPVRTLSALTTWALPIWWPLLLLAAARRRLRVPVIASVVVPLALDYRRRRPQLDPLRWGIAALADDVSYGAGVWRGCVASGQWRPLFPRLAGHRAGLAHDDARLQRRAEPAQQLHDV